MYSASGRNKVWTYNLKCSTLTEKGVSGFSFACVDSAKKEQLVQNSFVNSFQSKSVCVHVVNYLLPSKAWKYPICHIIWVSDRILKLSNRIAHLLPCNTVFLRVVLVDNVGREKNWHQYDSLKTGGCSIFCTENEFSLDQKPKFLSSGPSTSLQTFGLRDWTQDGSMHVTWASKQLVAQLFPAGYPVKHWIIEFSNDVYLNFSSLDLQQVIDRQTMRDTVSKL